MEEDIHMGDIHTEEETQHHQKQGEARDQFSPGAFRGKAELMSL